MKFKSALVTQVSGSIGGMTGSSNRGGMYFRSRTIPTNPATPQQTAVRAIMSALTSVWSSTLTLGQRAAWETYAANVPLTGPLGDPVLVTGMNMFIRTNVPAIQVGLARIDVAPTIFDLGSLTPCSIDNLTSGINTVGINYDNTDEWATVTNGILLVQSSINVQPSINYFTGPYRQTGGVPGDTTTPPTSPTNITPVYPLIAAAKCFVVCRSLTADGRLSAAQQLSGLVT